jgi:Bax protein
VPHTLSHRLALILAVVSMTVGSVVMVATFRSGDSSRGPSVWTPPGALPSGAPLGAAPAPDFAAMTDARQRKEAFFAWLAPLVERENARVARMRERLEELQAKQQRGGRLDRHEIRFLEQVAERYRIDGDPRHSAEDMQRLLRRVDTVPPRLALAQAAVESGWGTSRFAREGNNYFGIWTWRGRGMTPARRASFSNHKVASYGDAAASVRAYLYTRAVGPAYRDLRLRREEARQAGRHPGALELAVGLSGYSERGDDYVHEIRRVLRGNARLLDAVLEGS